MANQRITPGEPREVHPGHGNEIDNVFHEYQDKSGVRRKTMMPWWWIDAKTREMGRPPTDEEIMTHEYMGESFVGTPFNETTGFTRSEPMDLAMRMLKQMSDEEMQEWAYENLRNQGIVIPDEREEEIVPKPKIPTLYY